MSDREPQPPSDARESQKGLTREQRRRRARIAAHASWANTADRAARTSSGTKAFVDRFERQVDPYGVLPDETRAAMAKHARTAYMLQLAEKSVAARRRRGQP